MTKKHFIELADAVKIARPTLKTNLPGMEIDSAMRTWRDMRDALADFCKSQNSRFDRARWLAYIAGECGPNGGKVAKS